MPAERNLYHELAVGIFSATIGTGLVFASAVATGWAVARAALRRRP